MEKLKNKHNHLFTDLIKVGIFGLMLLLPFLCFLPTGFYYGFNEHATNETTTQINYKYQSNEVNSIDDLVVGNIYEFNTHSEERYSIEDLVGEDKSLTFRLLTEIQLSQQPTFEEGYGFFQVIEPNCVIDLYYTDGNSYIGIYNSYQQYMDTDVTTLFEYNGYFLNNFIIQYLETDTVYYYYFQHTDYNVIESVETNVQDTISNKMYQAWEGVWTSPLFNWTNTTPLNNGLNGFVSIFGINQSSYIANCLIYLLSMTAIYVVFDIVLEVFKWLTHLLNK